MKLKTRWLATVSLTTLVLVAAGSLPRASQQIWNPEVAHAAKVTASLLKGKSIRPMFLYRNSSAKPIASLPLPLAHTDVSTTNIAPWNAEAAEFQNWVGFVDGTVKQQTYQIKKLEFQLAQEHYKAGRIAQSDLDEKAASYQQAAQEFKVFLDSYKMAN